MEKNIETGLLWKRKWCSRQRGLCESRLASWVKLYKSPFLSIFEKWILSLEKSTRFFFLSFSLQLFPPLEKLHRKNVVCGFLLKIPHQQFFFSFSLQILPRKNFSCRFLTKNCQWKIFFPFFSRKIAQIKLSPFFSQKFLNTVFFFSFSLEFFWRFLSTFLFLSRKVFHKKFRPWFPFKNIFSSFSLENLPRN